MAGGWTTGTILEDEQAVEQRTRVRIRRRAARTRWGIAPPSSGAGHEGRENQRTKGQHVEGRGFCAQTVMSVECPSGATITILS